MFRNRTGRCIYFPRNARVGEFFRRAVFSYSLASLYLLRSFNDFPYLRPPHEAYWRLVASTPMYATLLLVALLSVVIFGIVQWVASWGESRLRARRLVDGFLVFSMIGPAYQIKLLFLEPNVTEKVDAITWTIVRLVIISSAIAVTFLKQRRPYRVFVASILVVSPLYPISLLRAARWKQIPPTSAGAELQSGVSSRRVVWMLFDEADALSVERAGTPPDLELPEFDRLRADSLYVQNAYPAGAATLLSIPAMLAGRKVTGLRMRGPAELSVQWEGKPEWEMFGRQWTLFRGVRELGGNNGVAGWFHPYCRIFSSELADCYYEPFKLVRDSDEGGATIWANMRNDLIRAAISFPLVQRAGLLPSVAADERNRFHAQRLDRIEQRAKRQVTDPRLNFVLIHFPIPHNPYIYDRHTKSYSASGSYYDNLVLADMALGRLRRAMEQSGVWDSTTVVVTADHSWRVPVGREQDPRVPFFIKFPKSMGVPGPYAESVSTLVLAPLTMELLRGRLHSVEEAAAWMRSQHIVIESNKLLGKTVDFRDFEP